jgi:cobalamin biosynthesis protein CobT
MNEGEKADSLKAVTKKFRNTWFGKNSMNMKRFMPLIPTSDTDEDDDEDDDDDDDDDDEIDDDDDDDDEEYDEEDDDDEDDEDDDEVEEDNSESEEEEVVAVPVSPVKVTRKKSLITPVKKNVKKASKTKKSTKKVPSPSKKDNAPKESEREVSSVADVHFFTKMPCHSMAYLKTKVLLMVNADGTYASLFVVSLDGSNLSWVSDYELQK